MTFDIVLLMGEMPLRTVWVSHHPSPFCKRSTTADSGTKVCTSVPKMGVTVNKKAALAE